MNPAITTAEAHLLSAVASTPQEHENKMKSARPQKGQTFAASLALFIGIGCLCAGLWWNLRGEVRDSARAGLSPVRFQGKWLPMKPVYHPGETAYFKYVRAADFPEETLYLVSVMAFEDAGSGVAYNGGLGVRKLGQADRGTQAAYATRRIPVDVTPGKKYHLVGLVLAQTERRTLPIGIESEYFEVANWGSEQEKAAAAARRDADKPSDLPVEGDSSKTPVDDADRASVPDDANDHHP